jgi:NAD(P)-dependent dehydrogenase (short-subunit alcohol dehydrogenase family)
MLLKGKTCIIAGASAPKGIGRATALLFAEHGAKLVLADRAGTVDLARQLVDQLKSVIGGEPSIIAVPCDITDPGQCQCLVEKAVSEFGTVDVLVNSAGIVETRSLLDTSPADFDRMIDTNLKGAFNLCHAALTHFVSRNAGVIVNLASLAAQRGGGLVGGAHYASAKGGVLSLTRSIAREFGPLGIRANAICPAMAQTGMLDGVSEAALSDIRNTIPLRRLGTSSEVAGACLFLASDLSSFITGTTLDVNGGLHIH